MSINKALKILSQKKLILTVGVLLGVVLAMFGTFFADLEYKTSASFIVIQEQRFTDSFTQAKSAEYLGGILSQIVDTDSFRVLVLAQNPKIAGLLPKNELDLRKEWTRIVKAKAGQNTGILSIAAYNKDARASKMILDAVGKALISDSAKYLGSSANIKLVMIDGPVTSEFPVRPNLALNSLAGALISGILFSSVLLIKGDGKDRKKGQLALPKYQSKLSADKKTYPSAKKGDGQNLQELIKATRALSAKI